MPSEYNASGDKPITIWKVLEARPVARPVTDARPNSGLYPIISIGPAAHMPSTTSLMGFFPHSIKECLPGQHIGSEEMSSSGRFHPRADDLRSRLAEAFHAFPRSHDDKELSRFGAGFEFEFVSGIKQHCDDSE